MKNNTFRYVLATTAVIVACCLFAAETSVRGADLRSEGRFPELDGAVGWLNTPALSRNSLHGKVVLVNFWTYTCINSLRPLPYVKSWATKYSDAGLVVIGVHTPEFSFEHEPSNVEVALRDLRVTFPVAIDSDYKIWRAFDNKYWPAQYLIDGQGRIRYHHFGEGDYGEIERLIQQLIRENGGENGGAGVHGLTTGVSGAGVEAAPDFPDGESPETYVGYRQAERFASPTRVGHDSSKIYLPPGRPSLNEWGLAGRWNVGGESAELQSAPGKVIYRFHSRDLHLVLAPSNDGAPARFKVTLDGAAPGDDCGSDSAPDGSGVVREPRLYQLIRLKGPVRDRTFEIELLDPGARVFVFTFG